MTTTPAVPLGLDDPVNTAILAVSEDKLEGFQRDPFGEIASRSAIPVETVIERVRALLAAGTIRRVRQTLLSTNLADGALVAWQVPQERLHEGFDFMFQRDPDGLGDAGLEIPPLDDRKGAAGVLDRKALRLPGVEGGRGVVPTDAGEGALRPRRRPHATTGDGAWLEGG